MGNCIVQLHTATHQAVQELLPWFATQALAADEMAFVRDHLRTCTQCQFDLERQHQLREALPSSDTLPDVESALERLRPRLHRAGPAPPARRTFAFLRGLSLGHAWCLRSALALQAVLIAGCLSVLLVVAGNDGGAAYRGLSAPKDNAGRLVVMFKPETTERELRHILRESGARLADGPMVTDAYVLRVPGPQQARAISVLRSKPGVVLAAPLDSGERH